MSCDEIMCREKLYTKKNTRNWLLKNHPDKGGDASVTDIGDITKCMSEKQFCGVKNTVRSVKTNKSAMTNKSIRATNLVNNNIQSILHKLKRSTHRGQIKEPAYKPNKKQLDCIRQVSNWSKIGPANRFDKAKFSIKDTDALIPEASPKLEAMLQNIEALDKNDMVVFGKTFKHFIFSDVKLLGYGAKIISAGFIARGFKPVLTYNKATKKIELKKAGSNGFGVMSSTALWDKPFNFKLKKQLLDMFNARPDNIQGENCRFIILDSGFKEGIDLFDVRYVHLFEPLMTSADLTQALGRATRLCGQKGLDFVPNQGWPLHVFKYSQNIPESLQEKYKSSTLFEIALQLKGLDSRIGRISKSIHDLSILGAVDQPLTEEIHKSKLLPHIEVKPGSDIIMIKDIETMTKSPSESLLLLKDGAETEAEPEADINDTLDPCAPRVPPGCSGASFVSFPASRNSSKTIQPSIVVESNVLVLYEPTGPVPKKRPTNWFELRRWIATNFSSMKWPKQEVKNKCVSSGGALKLVEYTPTQDFISSYFRPTTPVKGMLLWHSVGTGKTCTAIALASRQFEPAGYTILWVTRHTLKSDIWKNIFDQVCHATIAKEVKDGLLKEKDIALRQRRLYSQWMPPISYKQFSNMAQGRNELFNQLKKRNGEEDPLKKTLIIIDEAHKLYSADFKGSEKPDVEAFMKIVQASYKISGADSARILLMTATPYNESPLEMMALLNLCRPAEKWLPTEVNSFIAKYMDDKGDFTPKGVRSYLNDIAGQISYLNREADPSQFAQPIFADIIVPISQTIIKENGEFAKQIADLEKEKEDLDKNVIPYLEKQIDLIVPSMVKKEGECETSFISKKEINECKKRVAKTYKEGLNLEKKNLKTSMKRSVDIKKEIAKQEKKFATYTKKQTKNSLSQQAQLETRCKIGVEPKK